MTETTSSTITVHTISGMSSLVAADRMEQELSLAAGVEMSAIPRQPRPSPTAFHVAQIDGAPLGVATTTVGPLAEVPLGLALTRLGVPVNSVTPVPSPVCELVNLAVAEPGELDNAAGPGGVSELLYRAFYQWGQSSGVRSLVVGLDPWLYDVAREQYGIAFKILGPAMDLLGRELLPVGGELTQIEEQLRTANPTFHQFLTAPT